MTCLLTGNGRGGEGCGCFDCPFVLVERDVETRVSASGRNGDSVIIRSTSIFGVSDICVTDCYTRYNTR